MREGASVELQQSRWEVSGLDALGARRHMNTAIGVDAEEMAIVCGVVEPA